MYHAVENPVAGALGFNVQADFRKLFDDAFRHFGTEFAHGVGVEEDCVLSGNTARRSEALCLFNIVCKECRHGFVDIFGDIRGKEIRREGTVV